MRMARRNFDVKRYLESSRTYINGRPGEKDIIAICIM